MALHGPQALVEARMATPMMTMMMTTMTKIIMILMMMMIMTIQRQNYQNNEQRSEGDGVGRVDATFLPNYDKI